jgi:mannan endo-1,4-beta-mannosidase
MTLPGASRTLGGSETAGYVGYGHGRGRHGSRRRRDRPHRGRLFKALAICLTAATAFALVVTAMFAWGSRGSGHAASWGPRHPIVIRLPAAPASYIGAYVHGVPQSYAPVESFATMNGVRPNIALYYSGWGESFRSAFATNAASHHAVTMVQIDPGTASMAAIAAGYYDKYLRSYARAVGDFGARTGKGVIIGFGHEPNGYWYHWGYKHVSPQLWISAWRHIVTVFRQQGAGDVTWLWTVNVIDTAEGIVSPARWWPGSRYVTWVGVDGYYYVPSARFAALFGPVIKVIRSLTIDPILVSETGVKPKAGKAAKIADEFSGIRAYGLLGLVWFDVRGWRLDTKAATAAFATAAKGFGKLAG